MGSCKSIGNGISRDVAGGVVLGEQEAKNPVFKPKLALPLGAHFSNLIIYKMQQELFRFGSIADIQYGDFENGRGEGRCQRFREVPGKLEQTLNIMHEHEVRLILTIGDIIEGHRPQSAADQADLDVITTIFSKARCPVAHTLGNHDVCLDREHLRRCLGMPACYYACSLHPGWKLLVLDTTDLSTGTEFKQCWPLDSPKYAAAKAYLDAHPQDDGANMHMFSWNGGIGKEQMRWLKEELCAAEQAGERVIVSSHHPLGLGSARRTHMAWNFEEMQATLCGSKACVLALAGHDHIGGYARIGHVHFVTQPAMVEAPEGGNAFGVIKVFSDKIEIDGLGFQVPNHSLQL